MGVVHCWTGKHVVAVRCQGRAVEGDIGELVLFVVGFDDVGAGVCCRVDEDRPRHFVVVDLEGDLPVTSRVVVVLVVAGLVIVTVE
ncbi:hypothetical protein [Haloarcula marismortui]|uniref:hypothetical protein n=1 Tax=Haloarcula marismortui TaxID=2238 RepID=UPI0012679BEE|nr:hypothetical protein [Haloarcula sinaiiensis]